MMDRRTFLCGLTVGTLAVPLTAEAQQAGKIFRVAYLSPGAGQSPIFTEAFRQGLRDQGYVEGQNILVDYRYVDYRYMANREDQYSALLADVIRSGPDLIFVNSTSIAAAVKRATRTIPVVFAGVVNPVEMGLIVSFAHPGGNLTGIASGTHPSLGAKRLELLQELVPRAKIIGVIAPPVDAGQQLAVDTITRAAQGRVKIHVYVLRAKADLDSIFAQLIRNQVAGLIVLGGPETFLFRVDILDRVATMAIPAIYYSRILVESGGLISYGGDLVADFRRAAYYVHRILSGTAPGDLPVEQATQTALVINLKTAKALGLTIPQTLLLRADQVIE